MLARVKIYCCFKDNTTTLQAVAPNLSEDLQDKVDPAQFDSHQVRYRTNKEVFQELTAQCKTYADPALHLQDIVAKSSEPFLPNRYLPISSKEKSNLNFMARTLHRILSSIDGSASQAPCHFTGLKNSYLTQVSAALHELSHKTVLYEEKPLAISVKPLLANQNMGSLLTQIVRLRITVRLRENELYDSSKIKLGLDEEILPLTIPLQTISSAIPMIRADIHPESDSRELAFLALKAILPDYDDQGYSFIYSYLERKLNTNTPLFGLTLINPEPSHGYIEARSNHLSLKTSIAYHLQMLDSSSSEKVDFGIIKVVRDFTLDYRSKKFSPARITISPFVHRKTISPPR